MRQSNIEPRMLKMLESLGISVGFFPSFPGMSRLIPLSNYNQVADCLHYSLLKRASPFSAIKTLRRGGESVTHYLWRRCAKSVVLAHHQSK